MSRLVVVSNRVSKVSSARATSAGGLAVGVMDALSSKGGVWFGWSGEITDQSADTAQVHKIGKIEYVTVDLSHEEHENYYENFANRTLWPLFHFRLDLAQFDRDWYVIYRRVNQQFAEHLMPHLRDDDIIWVHDYHFIPFASELRRLGFRGKIGFFLHIPFPSSDFYRAMPWHDALMESMSHYDLLGFQTADDLRNLVNYVQRSGRGQLIRDGLLGMYYNQLRIGIFPIGIDTENFAAMAQTEEAGRQSKRLRESLLNRPLMIGVDRLDYSKGIPERLRSFESLLKHYPDHRENITYVQISAPTREKVPEYDELRKNVENHAGRINGSYSTFDWVPLRYINRSIARKTLAGFYRVSKIGLVTPLRDGMNLVAKEYVAAQDPEDPGVLVLSCFAGAVHDLKDAVVVNPYDTDGVADALDVALKMPLSERQQRWRLMMDQIEKYDISTWRSSFLSKLVSK